jgi:hypothetical protein
MSYKVCLKNRGYATPWEPLFGRANCPRGTRVENRGMEATLGL